MTVVGTNIFRNYNPMSNTLDLDTLHHDYHDLSSHLVKLFIVIKLATVLGAFTVPALPINFMNCNKVLNATPLSTTKKPRNILKVLALLWHFIAHLSTRR